MPMKDDFSPDNLLPIFLSERADKPEQSATGIALDRTVIWSRVLKTSILVITAAVIAFLLVGSPVAFFANITASLVDISAFRPGTDQSTPTIQSTADAQPLLPIAKDAPPVNPSANPEAAAPSDDTTALRPPTQGSPTATDAPTRNEIAAASEPTDQSQTGNRQPSADALFKQFQAWVAEQDPRAQVGPVQPAQDAPAQVLQDARPQVRHLKKHRQVQPVQNARTEIRPERDPRAKVRREQNARVQVPPVQDARAQDQSVQNAPAPSFLQSLGLGN
jgi:cytoskeletal protein RodZ